LTQSLAALNARYHNAAPTERTQLLKNLLALAADRQQVLADLMEDYPEEVLRLALPDALRNSLPTAVQPSIESRVTIEGALEVQVEDRTDGHRYHYILETAAERLRQGEFEGLIPQWVVLAIGTNNLTATENARANTPPEVVDGIEAICREVHKRSPASHIILMAILPRGQQASNPLRTAA